MIKKITFNPASKKSDGSWVPSGKINLHNDTSITSFEESFDKHVKKTEGEANEVFERLASEKYKLPTKN